MGVYQFGAEMPVNFIAKIIYVYVYYIRFGIKVNVPDTYGDVCP